MSKYDPHNPTVDRKIEVKGDDYCDANCAVVTINGYEYGMNIDYVPEDKREWFISVFGDILERADKQARQEVRKDHEKRLRELCGIKSCGDDWVL